jgi:hypothetical protein
MSGPIVQFDSVQLEDGDISGNLQESPSEGTGVSHSVMCDGIHWTCSP